MTRHMLIIFAGLVAALVATMPAAAQEIHYWGKLGTDGRQGLIQIHRQYFSVAEGDEIPGLGTVHKVTDRSLIVHRRLTEEEKEASRSQGQVVMDVEVKRIPNLSLRLVPVPGPVLRPGR